MLLRAQTVVPSKRNLRAPRTSIYLTILTVTKVTKMMTSIYLPMTGVQTTVVM